MKQFYPGWVMRLYYHTADVTATTLTGLCDIACSDASIDLCGAADNPRLGDMQILHPQMWRFMPAVDVQVCWRYLARKNSHFGNVTSSHCHVLLPKVSQ